MSSAPVKRDVGNPQDGLAKKRRKGATRLSCAECRRLKLRCDRSIPCGSCIKRGCGAICPDGSLTTGQGNRFVLASTQELHEKIAELANRVRELEDALRSSHQHLSNEPHPLLSEELLRIKAPLQREVPAFRNQPQGHAIKEEEHNPDVVDAFGSLSITLSGSAKYFGTTANSWYFLQVCTPPRASRECQTDNYSFLRTRRRRRMSRRMTTLRGCRACFLRTSSPVPPPFPSLPSPRPPTKASPYAASFWYLPPGVKAAALRDIYFTYAAWMYAPISPESFEVEVYSQFYDPNASGAIDQPLLAHRLSLMFIVLAIGSLMDTNEPAYNLEAEKYHQLARAALFLHSFFDQPTINAVQSLFLMAYYLFLADRHGTGSGARWAIMGIAVKVAQIIFLDRDSGRWKVDPIETQKRRELFWELYTYDSWQCLTFGRPTSLALAHVDCKLPHGNDPADDQAFHAWKHRFCSETMILLHDQAFGAKTPTYATVLQLDRKMRAFPVPPILQVAGFGNSEPRPGGFPETIMLTLQRHIVLAIREMNLLYLHRSFFARAISDHPKDPLGSPYGTSVIAAYRSAGSLVALMRNLHSQLKEPSERIWFLWTHMFSCAIILGSIVTRCPSMSLAPSALVQLDSACELFSKAARGFRAVKVLNIMLRLQEKAHHSLEDFRKGKLSPAARRISPESPSPIEDNDELSTLGGKTRLVAKKEPTSPLLLERSPTSHNPVVPLPLSPGSLNEQVHPGVLEYLNSFQQPSATQTYADVDVDISPVSMYGMSSMQGSYHSESNGSSYISQSPTQLDSQSMFHQNQPSASQHAHSRGSQPQQQQRYGMGNGMGNGAPQNVSFPQYFPVYDYRTTTGMNDGFANTPILDMNPMPGQRRASSGSPEGNMQSSIWQDFVGDLMN
ncbi:Fungal-trans domain-containing protein [Mycena sanguinolenta]|uniref:Fungal-trans domain-containing protein n=1 Tax=Mycena sanguinolenta TaxID=230812 RepID=A0A8H7DGR9_9AGAR|nr:Fungal-trans domain-containing protein [Mycena sanguinolenta]